MTTIKCTNCLNVDEFCIEHQKHEKAVFESPIFAGRHDTQEFRLAIHDARIKDMNDREA